MKRILIAEDDRISQELLIKFIEGMGHVAFVSPHGKHAYEALKASNRFDLLITDVMMPEMDGKQLVQTLRGDTEFMDFPIIIISAVIGLGEISRLLDMGATWFMGKPVDKEELRDYVERSLIGREKDLRVWD
ncbi:MAG: response regulator [Thermodesulfobacteriota bacterium]|nr:response regulator [Thermodesulfobacteriota bacterium]